MKINYLRMRIFSIFKLTSLFILAIFLGIMLTVGEFFYSKINGAVYQQVIQEGLKKRPDVGSILLSGKSAKWADDLNLVFFLSSANTDVGIVKSTGQDIVLSDINIPALFPKNKEYYDAAHEIWDDYLHLYRDKNFVNESDDGYLRWKNAPAKMRDY